MDTLPPTDPRARWRVISLVVFAVFMLAAALYPPGARVLSGHDVADFDVRQGAPVSRQGLAWPRTSSLAHEVGPVHLAPAMNPVRVLAHVDFDRIAAGAPVCRIAMRDAAGSVVWSEARDFATYAVEDNSRHPNRTTLEIETFDVAREGDYRFAVDVDAKRDDALGDLRLSVRRNVAAMLWPLEIALGVMGLAGLVGVLLTVSPRKAPAESAAP